MRINAKKVAIVAAIIGASCGLPSCTFTTDSVGTTSDAGVVHMANIMAAEKLLSETMFKYFNGHLLSGVKSIIVTYDADEAYPSSAVTGHMFADLGFDLVTNKMLDADRISGGSQTSTSPNYTAVWFYDKFWEFKLTVTMNDHFSG